jgi:hypothetical protein
MSRLLENFQKLLYSIVYQNVLKLLNTNNTTESEYKKIIKNYDDVLTKVEHKKQNTLLHYCMMSMIKHNNNLFENICCILTDTKNKVLSMKNSDGFTPDELLKNQKYLRNKQELEKLSDDRMNMLKQYETNQKRHKEIERLLNIAQIPMFGVASGLRQSDQIKRNQLTQLQTKQQTLEQQILDLEQQINKLRQQLLDLQMKAGHNKNFYLIHHCY